MAAVHWVVDQLGLGLVITNYKIQNIHETHETHETTVKVPTGRYCTTTTVGSSIYSSSNKDKWMNPTFAVGKSETVGNITWTRLKKVACFDGFKYGENHVKQHRRLQIDTSWFGSSWASTRQDDNVGSCIPCDLLLRRYVRGGGSVEN